MTEVDELRREHIRRGLKLDAANAGLDRWCAWQDAIKDVLDEMEIRSVVEKLLIERGMDRHPVCRHAADLGRVHEKLISTCGEVAALRAEVADLTRRLDDANAAIRAFVPL